MKIAIEIYSEIPLNIKEDTYFKTALTAGGNILPDSVGSDDYRFQSIILSGKRVAGLGREFTYTLSAFPAGMGPTEGRPGKYIDLVRVPGDIALSLETNLILDPGILTYSLGIRLVNESGKSYDVPLCRPDVKIRWNGRGSYTIPLADFLWSKYFFQAS